MTRATKLTRRDAIRAGATLLTLGASGALAGCGSSSPTSPSVSGGTGNSGGSTTRTVTATVRAVETFTGRPLSVDFVLEAAGTKYSGRTDGEGVTLPAGTYNLRIGLDGENRRSDPLIVPSTYQSFRVEERTEFTTDLPEHARLFAAYDVADVIQAHRGRRSEGINKRWASRPRTFNIFDDGTFLNQPNPKSNAAFDNYLRIMAVVSDFTGGLIAAPSPDEVNIISGFPPGTGPNQPVGSYDQGSYNYVQSFRNGVYEWQGEDRNEVIWSAPWDDLRPPSFSSAVAEAIASTQGGDNSSLVFRCIYDAIGFETPVDRNWGRFNNRHRKIGESISVSEFGFAMEQRLR